jgi:hypothetical protein
MSTWGIPESPAPDKEAEGQAREAVSRPSGCSLPFRAADICFASWASSGRHGDPPPEGRRLHADPGCFRLDRADLGGAPVVAKAGPVCERSLPARKFTLFLENELTAAQK